MLFLVEISGDFFLWLFCGCSIFFSICIVRLLSGFRFIIVRVVPDTFSA